MQKIKRAKPTGNFTLDTDVAERLRIESAKTEVPMSRLANRALRKMFGLPEKNKQPAA